MTKTKEKTKFLDDLEGEEREIIQAKSTIVDKLNHVKEHLFTYVKSTIPYLNYYDHESLRNDALKIKNKADTLLKNINYQEIDLKDFILSNTNLDLEEKQTSVLGIYSGILLDNLNLDFFYINGIGNEFSHLFEFSNNCKNLVIDNFKGDEIGYGISNSNILALINNKGYHIGSDIAAYGSKINKVFFYNNIGDGIGHGIARKGFAEKVIYLKNSGDNKTITDFLGDINTLVAIRNETNNTYELDFEETILKKDTIKELIYKDNKRIYFHHLPIDFEDYINRTNIKYLLPLADHPDKCRGEKFATTLIELLDLIK
ncbi:hypothetical protein ACFL1H_08085 [Nanoarchaeota archaeon]